MKEALRLAEKKQRIQGNVCFNHNSYNTVGTDLQLAHNISLSCYRVFVRFCSVFFLFHWLIFNLYTNVNR